MNHPESAQVYLYVPANDRRKLEKAAQLFPNQLTSIRQKADEHGIQLGLWMNPMGILYHYDTVTAAKRRR